MLELISIDFLQMVTGEKGHWAESKLATLSALLNTATGGLQQLWDECGRDREVYMNR